MAKSIEERLQEIYFEYEFNMGKQLTDEQKNLIEFGYNKSKLDFTYQENKTKKLLIEVIGKVVPDGNRYDCEKLTEPYMDYGLTDEQIYEIQEWNDKVLEHATGLAISVVENLKDYEDVVK